jgi:hypothetical protein
MAIAGAAVCLGCVQRKGSSSSSSDAQLQVMHTGFHADAACISVPADALSVSMQL